MSKNIVEFIQSLNKSEKRYIHLYLKTFSEKENINLQDFLEIEKSTIRKKYTPNLKGNTTRLYYKLLDILAEYHREKLNNNNIDYINLNRAKLLFYKGQPEEAERIISKILEKPSGDNHLVKIESIELRLINAIHYGQLGYLSSQFENDKALLKTISEEYTNLINYEILWAATKFESSSNYFFDNTNALSEKQYNDYLSDESKAISPMAKILYHKLKGYECIKKQDIESAFEHTKKSIAIFQEHQNLIQANTIEYLKSIRNYAIALNFNKKPIEALQFIADIENNTDKNLLNKGNYVKIEAFILFVLMRMDLIINSKTTQKYVTEFYEFEKRFHDAKDYLPPDDAVTSAYMFVIFHLNNNMPRKTIRYINFITKHAGQARRDIHRLAVLAEMATHFRLGNLDLFESKLNSYKKLLAKNAIVFGFENELPKLLQTIFNEPDNKSLYNSLNEIINQNLVAEKKEIYLQFNPFITMNQ